MTITKVQILVEAKEPGYTHRHARLLPDDEQPAPPTLANLRKDFGDALMVELHDGFGMKQRFSLARFAHLDPDTYIDIVFRSAPADFEFPPLEPGVVLIREYLLAGPNEE